MYVSRVGLTFIASRMTSWQLTSDVRSRVMFVTAVRAVIRQSDVMSTMVVALSTFSQPLAASKN